MSQQLVSYPCSFGSAKIIFYANKEGRMPESVGGGWGVQEKSLIEYYSLNFKKCPAQLGKSECVAGWVGGVVEI